MSAAVSPISADIFLRWRAGEVDADEHLTPTIYAELRGLARHYLRRERAGHTLQPTELVHEAYMRLIGGRGEANDRNHFVALAARTMRCVLVDHARRKQADKRFPQEGRVTLQTGLVGDQGPDVDVLALDDALERLAMVSSRAAQLVELRFFGGLTCEESADVLDTSLSSVERDWRAARAWLRKALSD